MNILDIVIAVIVGFCLVRGIFRGIVMELTSIAGVFVGFYGAYYLYSPMTNLLSRLFAQKPYLNALSFLLTFTLLFLAVGLIGFLLKKLLKALELGWADRILGGTFGFFKAVLIVTLLLVPLTAFLPKDASLIRHSFLAPQVITVSEKLVLLVPAEMKKKFAENIKPLKEAWKK